MKEKNQSSSQLEPVVVIESISRSKSGCNDFQAEEVEINVPPPPPKVVRYCVNTTEAKKLDEECKAEVISMLVDATNSPSDLVCEDEVNDDSMDNLARVIHEGYVFKNYIFGGGVAVANMVCMTAWAKHLAALDYHDNPYVNEAGETDLPCLKKC